MLNNCADARGKCTEHFQHPSFLLVYCLWGCMFVCIINYIRTVVWNFKMTSIRLENQAILLFPHVKRLEVILLPCHGVILKWDQMPQWVDHHMCWFSALCVEVSMISQNALHNAVYISQNTRGSREQLGLASRPPLPPCNGDHPDLSVDLLLLDSESLLARSWICKSV